MRSASVYGVGRPADAPCPIGSVKPNFGHLEGGAGVVGLIKAALALHHEAIPPTAGVRTLNPAIDWANSGLRVPTEVEPWHADRGHAPARGGLQLRLRRHHRPRPDRGGAADRALSVDETPPVATPSVIPISARSAARLRTQAQALADHLRGGDEPIDRVAATSWLRRSHEPVRAAVVAEDVDGVAAALHALRERRAGSARW